MAKREFLMLAHSYKETKHNYAGYYASEKLDGMRCFWDGGISYGVPAKEVPWANTEKHDRFVDPNVIATGLWSRYGQVIRAPNEWIKNLPPIPLDGELYIGHKKFQELVSIVKRHESNDWDTIRYAIFDSPTYNQVFATGLIDNKPNFVKWFVGCDRWACDRAKELGQELQPSAPLSVNYRWLCNYIGDGSQYNNGPAYVLDQIKLDQNPVLATTELEELFIDITTSDGEGVIVRDPKSYWKPERTHSMLKVKPFEDMTVTVTGFTFGKETDRGSKHLGRMGSLRVKDDTGRIFDVSGFTDVERELISGNFTKEELYNSGVESAGTVCLIDHIVPRHFPIGSKITIKYRELTRDNIPKEARYWRKFQGV